MQALTTSELDRVLGGAAGGEVPERKPPETNPAALCGEKGLDYQVTVRDKEGREVWQHTVCKD